MRSEEYYVVVQRVEAANDWQVEVQAVHVNPTWPSAVTWRCIAGDAPRVGDQIRLRIEDQPERIPRA